MMPFFCGETLESTTAFSLQEREQPSKDVSVLGREYPELVGMVCRGSHCPVIVRVRKLSNSLMARAPGLVCHGLRPGRFQFFRPENLGASATGSDRPTDWCQVTRMLWLFGARSEAAMEPGQWAPFTSSAMEVFRGEFSCVAMDGREAEPHTPFFCTDLYAQWHAYCCQELHVVTRISKVYYYSRLSMLDYFEIMSC